MSIESKCDVEPRVGGSNIVDHPSISISLSYRENDAVGILSVTDLYTQRLANN